jgi:hypothetical protein
MEIDCSPGETEGNQLNVSSLRIWTRTFFNTEQYNSHYTTMLIIEVS